MADSVFFNKRAALPAVFQQERGAVAAQAVVVDEVGIGLDADVGDNAFELKRAPARRCPAAGPAQGDILAAQVLVSLDGHQRRFDIERFTQRFARKIEVETVVL